MQQCLTGLIPRDQPPIASSRCSLQAEDDIIRSISLQHFLSLTSHQSQTTKQPMRQQLDEMMIHQVKTQSSIGFPESHIGNPMHKSESLSRIYSATQQSVLTGVNATLQFQNHKTNGRSSTYLNAFLVQQRTLEENQSVLRKDGYVTASPVSCLSDFLMIQKQSEASRCGLSASGANASTDNPFSSRSSQPLSPTKNPFLKLTSCSNSVTAKHSKSSATAVQNINKQGSDSRLSSSAQPQANFSTTHRAAYEENTRRINQAAVAVENSNQVVDSSSSAMENRNQVSDSSSSDGGPCQNKMPRCRSRPCLPTSISVECMLQHQRRHQSQQSILPSNYGSHRPIITSTSLSVFHGNENWQETRNNLRSGPLFSGIMKMHEPSPSASNNKRSKARNDIPNLPVQSDDKRSTVGPTDKAPAAILSMNTPEKSSRQKTLQYSRSQPDFSVAPPSFPQRKPSPQAKPSRHGGLLSGLAAEANIPKSVVVYSKSTDDMNGTFQNRSVTRKKVNRWNSGSFCKNPSFANRKGDSVPNRPGNNNNCYVPLSEQKNFSWAEYSKSDPITQVRKGDNSTFYNNKEVELVERLPSIVLEDDDDERSIHGGLPVGRISVIQIRNRDPPSVSEIDDTSTYVSSKSCGPVDSTFDIPVDAIIESMKLSAFASPQRDDMLRKQMMLRDRNSKANSPSLSCSHPFHRQRKQSLDPRTPTPMEKRSLISITAKNANPFLGQKTSPRHHHRSNSQERQQMRPSQSQPHIGTAPPCLPQRHVSPCRETYRDGALFTGLAKASVPKSVLVYSKSSDDMNGAIKNSNRAQQLTDRWSCGSFSRNASFGNTKGDCAPHRLEDDSSFMSLPPHQNSSCLYQPHLGRDATISDDDSTFCKHEKTLERQDFPSVVLEEDDDDKSTDSCSHLEQKSIRIEEPPSISELDDTNTYVSSKTWDTSASNHTFSRDVGEKSKKTDSIQQKQFIQSGVDALLKQTMSSNHLVEATCRSASNTNELLSQRRSQQPKQSSHHHPAEGSTNKQSLISPKDGYMHAFLAQQISPARQTQTRTHLLVQSSPQDHMKYSRSQPQLTASAIPPSVPRRQASPVRSTLCKDTIISQLGKNRDQASLISSIANETKQNHLNVEQQVARRSTKALDRWKSGSLCRNESSTVKKGDSVPNLPQKKAFSSVSVGELKNSSWMNQVIDSDLRCNYQTSQTMNRTTSSVNKLTGATLQKANASELANNWTIPLVTKATASCQKRSGALLSQTMFADHNQNSNGRSTNNLNAYIAQQRQSDQFSKGSSVPSSSSYINAYLLQQSQSKTQMQSLLPSPSKVPKSKLGDLQAAQKSENRFLSRVPTQALNHSSFNTKPAQPVPKYQDTTNTVCFVQANHIAYRQEEQQIANGKKVSANSTVDTTSSPQSQQHSNSRPKFPVSASVACMLQQQQQRRPHQSHAMPYSQSQPQLASWEAPPFLPQRELLPSGSTIRSGPLFSGIVRTNRRAVPESLNTSSINPCNAGKTPNRNLLILPSKASPESKLIPISNNVLMLRESSTLNKVELTASFQRGVVSMTEMNNSLCRGFQDDGMVGNPHLSKAKVEHCTSARRKENDGTDQSMELNVDDDDCISTGSGCGIHAFSNGSRSDLKYLHPLNNSRSDVKSSTHQSFADDEQSIELNLVGVADCISTGSGCGIHAFSHNSRSDLNYVHPLNNSRSHLKSSSRQNGSNQTSSDLVKSTIIKKSVSYNDMAPKVPKRLR